MAGSVMGLPLDDPLRYNADGQLRSKEALNELLEDIIGSWPTWGDVRATAARQPKQQASLSGERNVYRTSKWLSR